MKLFDLYCANHNYQKAGECLDRAAEVDPYEPGHQKRVEMLRGKIDDQRFRVIAARFSTVKKEEQPTVKAAEPTLGAAALQDLMLQAEILVQYGMRSKAIERIQRIQELFPGEEQRNQDLQRLYISAGIEPARGVASAAGAATPSAQPAAPPVTVVEASDVSSLAKVAEITRKLYHQEQRGGRAKNRGQRNWRCVARDALVWRRCGSRDCRHRAYRSITRRD